MSPKKETTGTNRRIGGRFARLLFALLLLVPLFSLSLPQAATAHGFNANRVRISRLPNTGTYRVFIYYTHVEIGEYREAHIDFSSRAEALKVYWDLVGGADFFLGDVKQSVHFHREPLKNSPY